MLDHKCSKKRAYLTLAIIISLALFFPLQTVLAEDYFDKNFEWDYEGKQWTWNLSIPKSLYNSYKSVSISDRNRYGAAGWDFLVTTQDYYVKRVANKLHEAATKEGYGAYDEVSFILAFVQSLPYTSDSVTKGYDEYPRFPIETLVDDGGDCEDTSILFATLVLILNYGVIFISPPDHFAVGVLGTNLDGSYYTYNSKTYYYCETTSGNWKIGDIPSEYQNTSAYLYSIDQRRQYIPSQDTPRVPNQENEPKSFLEPNSEWLAIVLTAVLAGMIISAIYMFTKHKKVRTDEKIEPPPPPPF